MPEKQNRPDEPTYLVTTYRNGQFTTEHLTRTEVLALDHSDVDFHLDDVFGHIRIRTEDGDTIGYQVEIPGVGKTTRELLLVLMGRPGELLSPLKLARLTGNTWFKTKNNVSGRLVKLRAAFRDNAQAPWFFITRRVPYSIAWSAGRSFRHIEHIVLPTDEEAKGEQ